MQVNAEFLRLAFTASRLLESSANAFGAFWANASRWASLNIRMRAIILLLLLVGSPALGDEFRHYSQWTDEERAWFTTYAVASYIDYRQTEWAIQQTAPSGEYRYAEANPLLGPRPSADSTAALKLGVLAVQYWSMGRLGFENQNFRWGFKAATVVQVGVVINNDQLGISFTRAF